MMKTGAAAILLLALGADATNVRRLSQMMVDNKPVTPGFTENCQGKGAREFVVSLKEDLNYGIQSFESLNEATAFAPLHESDADDSHTYSLCFPAGANVEESLAALERRGEFASITENFEVTTSEIWSLDRVDQASLPLDNSFSPAGTGAGATVYVLDTGSVKHNDFGGRVENGYDAGGEYSNGNTDTNGAGHGTHCAGTIASKTYGVAKKATIVPVKVFGNGDKTSYATILKGINWAAADAVKRSGPTVISMSLGGRASAGDDPASAALLKAKNQGTHVVVAAGNDNEDACNFWPAGLDHVVTVGATTKTDAKSSFSNYGRCVDISAPGSSITSTKNAATGTRTISGTSMACPLVAGTVAVMAVMQPGLTPDAAKAQLVSNGVVIRSLNTKSNKFVQVPTGVVTRPTPVPVPTPSPITVRPSPPVGPPTPKPPTPTPTPDPTTPPKCKDYAGKRCDTCLASNNVCYPMGKSWCDAFSYTWCA